MPRVTFTTEDRAYLRHGARDLLVRLYRPAAPGKLPAVIDIHGGAWCNGDRLECAARDTVLAEAGLFVAAIDFRQGADGYPAPLLDINYAIRWLKSQAAELGIDPARVALSGQSSGGHLAMLTAMRPHDTRYGAIPLPMGAPPVDASVAAVAMTWPVINPLGRYRHARRALDAPTPPAWVGDLPQRHDLFWKTEAAMDEGNPLRALERGETVRTPPALWIQGRPDPVHDYRDPESPVPASEPERFAGAYRQAGGRCELQYVAQANRGPDSAPLVARFLRAQLGA
ncbi:MAG: alpha/beta hydrolase [Rhodospirillales bacterium]|nr:alpha/beta hydrolase [Rhodospirillales bacterium]